MMILYRHLVGPNLPGYKALGLTLFSGKIHTLYCFCQEINSKIWASLVAFFSLACGFALKFFDKRRDAALRQIKLAAEPETTEDVNPDVQLIGENEEKFKYVWKYH